MVQDTDARQHATVLILYRDELWRLRSVREAVLQEPKAAQGAVTHLVAAQIELEQFLHAPPSLPRGQAEHGGAEDDSQHEVKVESIEQQRWGRPSLERVQREQQRHRRAAPATGRCHQLVVQAAPASVYFR